MDVDNDGAGTGQVFSTNGSTNVKCFVCIKCAGYFANCSGFP